MHPNHNYRHSRRSACDRCRGQKLRCERDHMNGMSCERCLKAQEICITSMNQPAQVILPSNHGQNLVARDDREHQRFNPRHKSISVLHKSSGSRVKKLVHSPSPIPRRHSMKEHHYWGGVQPMPVFPTASFCSPSADFGFNMPLELGNMMVPVEQWSDPLSKWSTDAYNLPSDWMPSDQLYPCEANSCFPSAFTNDALPGARQATEMAISDPFQITRLKYGENESPFGIKELPDSAWVNQPDPTTITKPPPTTTSQAVLSSLKDIRKSLLRLKIGLLEDLELFENGSTLLQSSSLFYEDSNLSIETLDLPIYRLVEHSSWLLAIIRSSCGMAEESLDATFATQRFEPENSRYEDSLFILPDAGDSGGDEGGTTISPHDSGYHTTVTSPDRTTSSTIPRCDIALWLGILEAHCSLVRIYRAIFMRLYQLFLIIPPTDAATILLLPKVRFGQFHLDGNLIVQIQLLVDFSSTMMSKLDQALKLRSSSAQHQEDQDFDPSQTLRQKGWPTSIRDIVLAQEQDPCEMSLMEIMDCLRQLVKDTVVI
ncbi:hypothetical protein N7537_003312 [Penicillium hordei]|uniref:Zn(2)-C6 fungal-type domain-containing protein n=1 Tax=Penicillium hordei TaxID=40994 RepID=A0AAD6H9T1_9EURO|nr:uncharacterized protein N7537_003312 [Penicillium hordei]KAJ5618198.1 hypothetical protein N7537_003312 [Penicillium hordei]